MDNRNLSIFHSDNGGELLSMTVLVVKGRGGRCRRRRRVTRRRRRCEVDHRSEAIRHGEVGRHGRRPFCADPLQQREQQQSSTFGHHGEANLPRRMSLLNSESRQDHAIYLLYGIPFWGRFLRVIYLACISH